MEQGTYNELWKNKNYYYNLVKNQLELGVWRTIYALKGLCC